MAHTLDLSVREFVEFLLMSGSIDDGDGALRDSTEAMRAGAKLHRKLQKAAGSNYHAEVSLSCMLDYERFSLKLSGRADGIIYDEENEKVLIDEIKGMYADVKSFESPIVVHLAQARCYGYMWLLEHENLNEIDIRISYVNLEDETNTKQFLETLPRSYLFEWMDGLKNDYEKWGVFSVDHEEAAADSAKALSFPFEYRPGQKELVARVYTSIKNRNTLFIQAPTGVGKTISTVFPSVAAIGQGLIKRIFYLTARTITRTVAIDTVKLLLESGWEGSAIVITAKDKVCPMEERLCNPIDCARANGHYDRLLVALYDLITHESLITRDVIEEYAKKHEVCPFELTLDASLWVDIIICDYNYAFDMDVYLKRYFMTSRAAETVLLVDEAHNLVDRAREMYSGEITKAEIRKVKKLLGTKISDIPRLYEKMKAFIAEYPLYGEEKEEYTEIFFKLRTMSLLLEDFDEAYSKKVFDDVKCQVKCIDPSMFLTLRSSMCAATVFFSATLLPIDYYKSLLTKDDEAIAVYAPSPFDPKKRRIHFVSDVSSRYRDRGPQMYHRMAMHILRIVNERPGNYMVFGPSYSFLGEVASYLDEKTLGARLLMQSSDMSEADREAFLTEFEAFDEKENSVVAFCTLGGIFSEGIDLRGEALIGVIILGAGLPQVDDYRKMISDFFDEKGKSGFDFAYLYPGMNKVVQAAGRLIRTEEDEGDIYLLDDRFLRWEYKNCMPREWFM